MGRIFRFIYHVLIWTILGSIVVLAGTFAVFNREIVTIKFTPLPFSLDLPLFALILGALALGLIIGTGLSSFSRLRLKWLAKSQRKRAEALENAVNENSNTIQIPQSVRAEQNRKLALNQD